MLVVVIEKQRIVLDSALEYFVVGVLVREDCNRMLH